MKNPYTQNQNPPETYGQGWGQPAQNSQGWGQPAQNSSGWGQPVQYSPGWGQGPAAGAAGVPVKNPERTASPFAKAALRIGGIAAVISALMLFIFFTSAFPVSVWFRFHDLHHLYRMFVQFLPIPTRALMGVLALSCTIKWAPRKLILPAVLSILSSMNTLMIMHSASASIQEPYLTANIVMPVCTWLVFIGAAALPEQASRIPALISGFSWGITVFNGIVSVSNMLGLSGAPERILLLNWISGLIFNAALVFICLGLVFGRQNEKSGPEHI